MTEFGVSFSSLCILTLKSSTYVWCICFTVCDLASYASNTIEWFSYLTIYLSTGLGVLFNSNTNVIPNYEFFFLFLLVLVSLFLFLLRCKVWIQIWTTILCVLHNFHQFILKLASYQSDDCICGLEDRLPIWRQNTRRYLAWLIVLEKIGSFSWLVSIRDSTILFFRVVAFSSCYYHVRYGNASRHDLCACDQISFLITSEHICCVTKEAHLFNKVFDLFNWCTSTSRWKTPFPSYDIFCNE